MIKTKESRLDVRISPDSKKLINRAAQLKGVSVSTYVVSHAIDSARKDIAEAEALLLSKQDVEVFYKIMTNPPEPNQALKDLMKATQV